MDTNEELAILSEALHYIAEGSSVSAEPNEDIEKINQRGELVSGDVILEIDERVEPGSPRKMVARKWYERGGLDRIYVGYGLTRQNRWVPHYWLKSGANIFEYQDTEYMHRFGFALSEAESVRFLFENDLESFEKSIGEVVKADSRLLKRIVSAEVLITKIDDGALFEDLIERILRNIQDRFCCRENAKMINGVVVFRGSPSDSAEESPGVDMTESPWTKTTIKH